MFPRGYFPDGFFPNSYWPSKGEEAAVTGKGKGVGGKRAVIQALLQMEARRYLEETTGKSFQRKHSFRRLATPVLSLLQEGSQTEALHAKSVAASQFYALLGEV